MNKIMPWWVNGEQTCASVFILFHLFTYDTLLLKLFFLSFLAETHFFLKVTFHFSFPLYGLKVLPHFYFLWFFWASICDAIFLTCAKASLWEMSDGRLLLLLLLCFSRNRNFQYWKGRLACLNQLLLNPDPPPKTPLLPLRILPNNQHTERQVFVKTLKWSFYWWGNKRTFNFKTWHQFESQYTHTHKKKRQRSGSLFFFFNYVLFV